MYIHQDLQRFGDEMAIYVYIYIYMGIGGDDKMAAIKTHGSCGDDKTLEATIL